MQRLAVMRPAGRPSEREGVRLASEQKWARERGRPSPFPTDKRRAGASRWLAASDSAPPNSDGDGAPTRAKLEERRRRARAPALSAPSRALKTRSGSRCSLGALKQMHMK